MSIDTWSDVGLELRISSNVFLASDWLSINSKDFQKLTLTCEWHRSGARVESPSEIFWSKVIIESQITIKH